MENLAESLDVQLSVAAADGEADMCRDLVAAGANVNFVNPHNLYMSPLHEAVRNGRVAACRALLEVGANVHAKCVTIRSETALHMASGLGHVAICKLLIKHGAKVDAKEESGQTPLHGVSTADVATVLLDAGAKRSARTKGGFTPLHSAALHNLPDVCRVLVEAGANVDDSNRGRLLTPLQRAVAFDKLDAVRYFIHELGLPVDQVTYNDEPLTQLTTNEELLDLLRSAQIEQVVKAGMAGARGSSKGRARDLQDAL